MQEEHFFVFVSSVLHVEQAAMAMLVKMERAVQIKIVPITYITWLKSRCHLETEIGECHVKHHSTQVLSEIERGVKSEILWKLEIAVL